MIDELLRHTEPCDTCPRGIAWIRCYDDIRRCRNCVHELAADNGWDKLPEPAPANEPTTAAEEPGTGPDVTEKDTEQISFELGPE